MSKTIFITGTSTGLGRLTALHFADKGWKVAATLRTPEKETELQRHANIQVFKLDVTRPEEVAEATAAAVAAFGRIDVVVNNAGQGMYGALELATEEAIDRQLAVNVRGPINVIRAFVPHFRAHGGGLFINISSLMGLTSAVPLGSLYNMSKFALEGLTEGLYYELEPQNIHLRLIEQGGSTGNNFGENMTWSPPGAVRDYDALTGKVKAMMASAGPELVSDPQEIVDAIEALATGTSTQFRTPVGAMTKNVVALRKSLPIEEFLTTMAANFR